MAHRDVVVATCGLLVAPHGKQAVPSQLAMHFRGGEQQGRSGGGSDPQENLIIVLTTHVGITDAKQIQFRVRTCDWEPLLDGAEFTGRDGDMALDIEIATRPELRFEGRHGGSDGAGGLWQGEPDLFVALPSMHLVPPSVAIGSPGIIAGCKQDVTGFSS